MTVVWKKAAACALSVALLAVVVACSIEGGEKSNARVAEPVVTLTWDAETDPTVTAFHVYAVQAATTVAAAAVAPEGWTLVEEYAIPATGFDRTHPTLSMTPSGQVTLKTFAGTTACFRIAAFSAAGESPRSNVVCAEL